MLTQTFPFDSILNYTPSDADKLQISGGLASLKLQDYPDNDFTENFDSETGHAHDANSEITGSKWQQIDQRGDALFGANYSTNQNANWSTGSGIGTLFGGATVTGGKLDLSGGVLSYVLYNPVNNLGINQGAIKFKLTPKYTGSPSSYQYIISTEALVGIAGEITLIHTSTGNLAVTIRNNVGTLIFSTTGFGSWSPTADQEYEIELNFYFDLGGSEIRLFVDGIQLGSTLTTGMTSTARGRFYVGCEWSASTTIDILVDDLMLFDIVQHTSNYTPGYTVPEYEYLESYDTLPEMEYTGAGTLVLLTALTYLKQGGLKIALQKDRSGVWDYWNGSAWATGDGTKDYMCTIEDFVANIATLVVLGSTIGQFKLYLPDSNTQGYIDFLTATLTAQIYPTDDPYYDINSRWYTDGLELISAVKTITGDDNIKIALKKGDTYYYIDSGVLTESDGTYSQSTTVEDWETYKALFTEIKTYIGVRIFFHSEDGQTTPELDTLTIGYNYAGVAPDAVETCIVDCTYIDANGTPTQSVIKYRRIFPAEQYKTSTIVERELLEKTPDTTGYWDIELVPGNYKFIINEKIFYKIVPNEPEANFWDLEDWS